MSADGDVPDGDERGDATRRNSLGRALPILGRLAEHPRGVALETLADETSLPKSTLHRLLASLCGAGFAEQLDNGSYRLGMEFVRTAFRFHDARDEPALVQPALDALTERFGEHAFFATLDGTEVVYLARAGASGEALRIAVRVGDRAPAHATALGKAILAFALGSDEAVGDWVTTHGPLVERSLAAVAGPLKLAQDLRVVRQRGYALERQESAGLDAIALPVFLDAPLRPSGAIGIVALAARTSADALAGAADEVRAIIEASLGEVTRPGALPEPPGDARAPSASATAAPAPAPRPGVGRDRRIVSVEPIVVHAGRCNYTFVRVGTRDGATGIGEATLEWQTESVIATVHELGRTIVGEDSGRIEHLWQRLRRGGFWRGGPVLASALSGIEHALWDLQGKRAGMPVYDLLGGACRDRVQLYASGPRGDTPEALASSAQAIVARGFGALKLAVPGPALGVDGAAALAPAVDAVEAVREAVGPGVRVAVDAHGRYAPAMAIRLARALEAADVWFLEEPALPDVPGGIAQVARATSIPVAAGERLHDRAAFHELLGAGIALVQPDTAHCGGLAEARRVAAMAEVLDIGLAPHNPLSPVNTVVSAHLALATPNFVALEYLVDDVPWRDALLSAPLAVADGALTLGTAPGLGIELDLDTCRAHPFRPVDRPSHRRDDGSVAEW